MADLVFFIFMTVVSVLILIITRIAIAKVDERTLTGYTGYRKFCFEFILGLRAESRESGNTSKPPWILPRVNNFLRGGRQRSSFFRRLFLLIVCPLLFLLIFSVWLRGTIEDPTAGFMLLAAPLTCIAILDIIFFLLPLSLRKR